MFRCRGRAWRSSRGTCIALTSGSRKRRRARGAFAAGSLAGFDLEHPAAAGEPARRAFLRALVGVRDARVREPARRSGLELEARSAMKRACPALFERSMETVGRYG
jgi:hypothetical protein